MNSKRFFQTALIALSALMLASFTLAQTLEEFQSGETFTIATANEIPYGWIENGDAKGIAPDVAEVVLANLGIENVEWVVTEFGSLIPGLKAGRFDMVAASQAVLPQRCQQVDFSIVGSSYGEGLLVQAGNPQDIHGYEAFVENSDLQLGIVSGADQLEFAQAMGIPGGQLVAIQSNADALSAVATGRIDAYAGTSLTVAGLAKESDKVEVAAPFNDPIIDGQPVRSWGAFTFPSESDALRIAYNAALKQFQQTDEWREIQMGHGLSEADVAGVFMKTTEGLCQAE